MVWEEIGAEAIGIAMKDTVTSWVSQFVPGMGIPGDLIAIGIGYYLMTRKDGYLGAFGKGLLIGGIVGLLGGSLNLGGLFGGGQQTSGSSPLSRAMAYVYGR